MAVIVEKQLPPLKTKYRHRVSVEVEPLYYHKYYDPRFSESQFAVQSLVSVKYKSVDESNSDAFEGLSCKSEIYLPFHDLFTVNPAAGKGNKIELIRKNIIDKLYIPFELELELELKLDDNDKNNSVADRILRAANSMMMELLKYSTSDKSSSIDPFSLCIVLPLRLEITNVIALPDSRMQMYVFWHHRCQKLDPNFTHNYKRAISRPRTMAEELEEERQRSVMEEEEEMEIEGEDEGCSCPICLEEMVVGYTTKLPCSHRFHLDCIWKWHKQSCPLCRATFNHYFSSSRTPRRITSIYQLVSDGISSIYQLVTARNKLNLY